MSGASFQSTVYFKQGFGVVGTIYDDGPRRAQPFYIVSASAAYNVFGNGFSITSQGIANAGNTGSQIFAGLLINPKGQPLYGSSGNPLSPSIVLPNNVNAELCTEGSVIVSLPAPCNIGDFVLYDNTTGALTTVAPGTSLPSGKSWAYAFIDRFTPSLVNGVYLGVATLTPSLAVPA